MTYQQYVRCTPEWISVKQLHGLGPVTKRPSPLKFIAEMSGRGLNTLEGEMPVLSDSFHESSGEYGTQAQVFSEGSLQSQQHDDGQNTMPRLRLSTGTASPGILLACPLGTVLRLC
ncbi:hypothetical protein LshimejAT787_0301060 [Lyophyllum shimeji]|uniref:Uncharacterized protein n=1 Tax=Lyophyllum shimeji TaxID=47721 RepID=A0A9P3PH41_LYOSH|nr:hypothetical protein LshimejAT787_0301060 [Lyophyllum shimeji]